MIIRKDHLIEISCLSQNHSHIELELEQPLENMDGYESIVDTIGKLKQTHYGDGIVFVGRFAESIVLCCGSFHKYTEEVGKDSTLMRLDIEGTAVTLYGTL